MNKKSLKSFILLNLRNDYGKYFEGEKEKYFEDSVENLEKVKQIFEEILGGIQNFKYKKQNNEE